jgi:hypothetical protein
MASMQAASPGNSPALPKLLLYLLAVMLGGALLAVPLFHLGKTGHAWLFHVILARNQPRHMVAQ